MKKKIFYFLLVLCSLQIAKADGTAGAKASHETKHIVDMPTAGLLSKGDYSIYSNFFDEGSVYLSGVISPWKNVNFGLSYSATGIIGSSDIKAQGIPGISVKVRLFNETLKMPAIALGLSTQGKGKYMENNKRFLIHSPGIYAAISKTYKWALGEFSTHGGITYSFEPKNEHRSVNFYAGIEHSIGSKGAFNIEYNANLDDKSDLMMSKQGTLNISMRLSLYRGITLGFYNRDMLGNIRNMKANRRVISIEFISRF